MHGHIREGRRWFELGQAASEGQPSELRARILDGASVLAGIQDDWERSQEFATDALMLYRELGDRRGTAVALHTLGTAAARKGDHDAARGFFEESVGLFRELDDRLMLSTAISNLGDVAFREGDFADAAERTREALAIQRSLGNAFATVPSLSNLGFIEVCAGHDEDAREALEECMLLAHKLGSSDNLAYAFEGLGAIAAAREDWERVARLLGRAEAIREATATELETVEQGLHEQTLAALTSAIEETELAAGLAAGRAMTDELAIDLALGLRPAAPA
jgi:tetratricopeptide (TPR) repeat protein